MRCLQIRRLQFINKLLNSSVTHGWLHTKLLENEAYVEKIKKERDHILKQLKITSSKNKKGFIIENKNGSDKISVLPDIICKKNNMEDNKIVIINPALSDIICKKNNMENSETVIINNDETENILCKNNNLEDNETVDANNDKTESTLQNVLCKRINSLEDNGIYVKRIRTVLDNLRCALFITINNSNYEYMRDVMKNYINTHNAPNIKMDVYIPILTKSGDSISLSDNNIKKLGVDALLYNISPNKSQLYQKLMARYAIPNISILQYEMFDSVFLKYDRVIFICDNICQKWQDVSLNDIHENMVYGDNTFIILRKPYEWAEGIKEQLFIQHLHKRGNLNLDTPTITFENLHKFIKLKKLES